MLIYYIKIIELIVIFQKKKKKKIMLKYIFKYYSYYFYNLKIDDHFIIINRIIMYKA